MKLAFLMCPDTPFKTWKHTCPWWIIFTFDNPIRKFFNNPDEILNPFVELGDTVLDIGCGMGFFSLSLAKLVGEEGLVIAADIQKKMLSGLKRRATRAGWLERIRLHQTSPGQIGLDEPVDFVLAFWMVHEVQQKEKFFNQIYDLLIPHGRFFMAETIFHVNGVAFERTVTVAQSIGLQVISRPNVRFSRVALFKTDKEL